MVTNCTGTSYSLQPLKITILKYVSCYDIYIDTYYYVMVHLDLYYHKNDQYVLHTIVMSNVTVCV